MEEEHVEKLDSLDRKMDELAQSVQHLRKSSQTIQKAIRGGVKDDQKGLFERVRNALKLAKDNRKLIYTLFACMGAVSLAVLGTIFG